MASTKKQITLSCQVDNYRSGWSIVEFLAHRFKYHTRETWEQRVRDGNIAVNHKLVTPDHVVSRDDEVAYTIWHAEPPVDFDYANIYEDEHMLAVGKSGNLPVHACGVFITHTLIARLNDDFSGRMPAGERMNLGHRLDRETSGLVLIGKGKAAARGLSQQFERGEVTKEYVAIVYGHVGQDAFEVDAPIGKIDVRFQYPIDYEYGKANDLATYLPKRAVSTSGKPARTAFEVIDRIEASSATNGLSMTLLRCRPVTGRTNQIRVHLHHAGHPIVGDKIYGLPSELHRELLTDGFTSAVNRHLVLSRHALHCYRLGFRHPITEEPMSLSADIPPDLGALLTAGTGDRSIFND